MNAAILNSLEKKNRFKPSPTIAENGKYQRQTWRYLFSSAFTFFSKCQLVCAFVVKDVMRNRETMLQHWPNISLHGGRWCSSSKYQSLQKTLFISSAFTFLSKYQLACDYLVKYAVYFCNDITRNRGNDVTTLAQHCSSWREVVLIRSKAHGPWRRRCILCRNDDLPKEG